MWRNMEDVRKTLFEYSHLEYPTNSFKAAPPKSVFEYRARMSHKTGLFDEEPETREIFISGRGTHHPGTFIRPGEPVYSTPEEDMDIRRKIREVSGLGYSNELIESFYGQKESSCSEEDEDDVQTIIPDIKLRSIKESTVNETKGKSPPREFSTEQSSPSHTLPQKMENKQGAIKKVLKKQKSNSIHEGS